MPDKKSPLHLSMFNDKREDESIYGLRWGDPDVTPKLKFIRDFFLKPNVNALSNIVEIGPGGGRWTRYMLEANKIYVVDPFEEILEEHKRTLDSSNIIRVLNNGTDFPGIPEKSINFVFSFDVFVHLDVAVIEEYLANMKNLLIDDALVFIHYADKTKPDGVNNRGFSVNHPALMRELVYTAGYTIVYENNTSDMHSSVMLLLNRTCDNYFPTGQIPLKDNELYDVVK